jgi:hypothetical protein
MDMAHAKQAMQIVQSNASIDKKRQMISWLMQKVPNLTITLNQHITNFNNAYNMIINHCKTPGQQSGQKGSGKILLSYHGYEDLLAKANREYLENNKSNLPPGDAENISNPVTSGRGVVCCIICDEKGVVVNTVYGHDQADCQELMSKKSCQQRASEYNDIHDTNHKVCGP